MASHAAVAQHLPHPAEAFAETIQGSPSAAEVMILFDLLPKTRPHAKAGLAPGAAFFAGAVLSDGCLQPRDTTRQFPRAVRKLCAFIHQADAAHPFGAFVILRNVHSSLHRDRNNTNSPNLVVPITAFEGGGVWVEHEGGQDFRWHQGALVAGRTHSFQDGPLYLQARTLLHETLPWEGDRAIIAAYMPANLDSLKPTDAAFLRSLGFHWQSDRPPVDEGHVGLSSLPSSLPVSQGPALGFSSSGPPVVSSLPSSLPVSQGPALGFSSSGPPVGFSSSGFPARFDSGSSVAPDPCQGDDLEGGSSVAPEPGQGGVEGSPEGFDPKTSRAFGQPMVCRYEMCKHEFTDGFGLCSPGRWAPEAREVLASKEEAGHAREIRDLLRKFVHSEIKDVRAEAFKLATGRLKGSPFSEAALSRIRGQIASVLGNPPDALEVAERQPFFLNYLARSLKALGDPDYDILVSGEECFARGVPVGYDAPLPRAPQIFRPREKFRKLDETEFEPQMERIGRDVF